MKPRIKISNEAFDIAVQAMNRDRANFVECLRLLLEIEDNGKLRSAIAHLIKQLEIGISKGMVQEALNGRQP